MKPFLYDRLRTSLLDEMLSGAYGGDHRFLSNRKIRQLWGVNQRTVDRSIADLKAQGLLEVHPRSGSRLAASYREKALLTLQREKIPAYPKVLSWEERAVTLRPALPGKRRWVALFDSAQLWHEPDWHPLHSRLKIGSERTLMKGFYHEAKQRGESVDFLWVPAADLSSRRLDAILARHQWDGAVFFRRTSTPNAFETADRFFQQVSLPTLTVFEPSCEHATPSLRVNDLGLGFEAAQRLVGAGAERFIILVNPVLPVYHQERITGARYAFREAGIDETNLLIHGMPFEESEPLAPELLYFLRSAKERRVGLFVLNNQLLYRLEPEIRQMRLHIPDQLSIITCGERAQTPLLSGKLSLMEVSFAGIGGMASRTIATLADGTSSRKQWLAGSHFRAGS